MAGSGSAHGALGRREARKHDRRAAIIEVARALFFERGYADTPMSLIASRVGGSKTTLWSYFPSKADLFAAVLDEVTARLQGRSIEALSLETGIKEGLYRFCLAFSDMILTDEAVRLQRMIAAEAQRFPELGKLFYERGPKATLRRLEHYLGTAMAVGKLRPADPTLAARHLVSLCQGATLSWRLWNAGPEPTPEQVERDVALGLDVFLRAYAPGP
ncbi:TetR/AcrR family transcriptional regulator [Pararhodospirillum oryzae]|uniref:TetR family transcriptional regulator n=1 Tax=Pararhodospirillum oryzae TaxID=478448 RepID=A0A512H5T7_9PROT|nr:TetR/AcrR family transcriptional regulator [Pararhodospirillum oryzae]GEO80836.1 TetR family transcriptional regulator [Pararhodospirillum oryzae]